MSYRNQETSHETSHQPALGISFQLFPDRLVFIPYAWLLRIDMEEPDRLTFSFSNVTVTLSGSNLQHVYEAAITAKLNKVFVRTNAPSPGKDWVQQIALVDNGADTGLQTKFDL